MLEPIIKGISANESERVLDQVATKTFFSLWSYPSLYRDVSGGKEVADLTVYFDNTLILFSDKGEVVFQDHKPTDVAWKRWYRAAISESAKQLHGAESFIRNHPSRVFLDRQCQRPFPFDLSLPDLKIHLICVTRNIGAAAKSYFDSIMPGSAGTLASFYELDEKEILERPFTINDINPKKTFVHVLDETGVDLLLGELATPTDFICYLKAKEHAIRKLNLLSTGGEEDLLAYYLENRQEDGYGSIPNPRDSQGPFMIHEWYWREFIKTVPYYLHCGEKKVGAGWASILRNFSDCIVNATVGEGHHLSLVEHSDAIKTLASENVVSRARLAKELFDKYHAVPEFVRSARVVPSLSNKRRLYVLLFFPWSDEYASYEEYRKDRLDCMVLYAHVAAYKYQKPREIVVFGSATKGATPGSETILVIDTSTPLKAEDRANAQYIMRYHDILNDITEIRSSNVEEKSPGRNEKCPCGSSKKFKKCCGNLSLEW
jgi:hypothetical protein